MHIDQFMDYLRFQRRYSDHTLTAYRNDLFEFQDFIEANYEIKSDWKDVSHHMIREWVIQLMDGGISPKSVNRKLSSLKGFFKFLIREGLVSQNPAGRVQAPKQKRQLLRVASEEEVSELLDRDFFPDDDWGQTQRAIIFTFYHTGIRLSELISLRVEDVDLHQNKITVTGKRNKQRSIPLTRGLKKILEAQLQRTQQGQGSEESGFLFTTKKGKMLYPKLVYNTINTYLSLVSDLEKKVRMYCGIPLPHTC